MIVSSVLHRSNYFNCIFDADYKQFIFLLYSTLVIILIFFVSHWFLSLFFQTFYLHRYASHKMFSTNKFNERVFHLLTFICQGSSFLNPRAYAIMHREHHAYSDTAKDPHSPHFFPDIFQMMKYTVKTFSNYLQKSRDTEERFKG